MKYIVLCLLFALSLQHYDKPPNCSHGDQLVCLSQRGCACMPIADSDLGCPNYSWNEDKPIPSSNLADQNGKHYCYLGCSPSRGCYGNGNCVEISGNTKFN